MNVIRFGRRKITKTVMEFEVIPRGWGIAYRDLSCNAAIVYPWPFHWVAGFIRSFWLKSLVAKHPSGVEGKILGWIGAARQAGFNHGYEVGYVSAKRDFERNLERVIRSQSA